MPKKNQFHGPQPGLVTPRSDPQPGLVTPRSDPQPGFVTPRSCLAHGSVITRFNGSCICAAIIMSYALPECLLFNPKFHLLITLTHMKGSKCVFFFVVRRRNFHTRARKVFG